MTINSRMNRVIEIVEAVQSDIEQILLLLKMDEEDIEQITPISCDLSEYLIKKDMEYIDSVGGINFDGCTRTDLDESANEQLKMFIQGLSYKKPSSGG